MKRKLRAFNQTPAHKGLLKAFCITFVGIHITYNNRGLLRHVLELFFYVWCSSLYTWTYYLGGISFVLAVVWLPATKIACEV